MDLPGWTDDLSVRLARGETVASLVEFFLAAEREGIPWPARRDVLTTRFALSFDDARLAQDRVGGGATRAATRMPADAPDPGRDPIAWESYRRSRGEPGFAPIAVRPAWTALVAAAANGDPASASALIDADALTTTEREAATRWRDAFVARGRTSGTDDVEVALAVAELANATLAAAGEPAAIARVLLQAATALSTAGEACIAGCADHGYALDGSQAWVDGVALVEASRRVAEHAEAMGDREFAHRALDLRARLATGLLGSCRAHVGAAMLDSIRATRRSGDDVRAADLCRSVAADFALVVDEWEPEAEAPHDEHRLAIDSLVAALDVLVALGVADADETRLRARAGAILAR